MRLKYGCANALYYHLSFVVVVDVITELARDCVLCELLYAGDLVLMSQIIQGIGTKFMKWKEAFDSKVLEVNLWKTKVVVYSLRVTAN